MKRAALVGAAAFMFCLTSVLAEASTTPPKSAPQPGWTPIAVSARGVVVDRKFVSVGGATFTLARFRVHTVAFHWHAGTIDPPGAAATLPADATSRISTPEYTVGVVGAFNGGFKSNSGSGGVVSDGVTLEPMRPGMATLAIDTHGQMRIGVWGSSMPTPGFGAVTYRQNLTMLVSAGHAVPSATIASRWGDTLHGYNGLVPRTGLGLDSSGNVIYVATMGDVTAAQLAAAMVAGHVTEGLELDINPFWPILGLAAQPIHSSFTGFGWKLPGSEHNPSIYESGWERDFFTVMEEPGTWTCSIATPGISHPGVMTPQPPRFVGTHCPA